MMNPAYKLILNEITISESFAPAKEFENYKQVAFLYLNHNGKHLFAEDILSRYNKKMTLERLLVEEVDHFLQGANQKKDGEMQRTWYDIQGQDEIQPTEGFFDFFFACKLRHFRLLEINDFLSYHMEYNFRADKKKFFNFLNACLSQQGNLLNLDIVATVKEWMSITDQISKEDEEKIKGRPPREAGDHLTSLNLNQTALLIELMQEARIILKEEYLTYAQAGKAFHLLTGYSTHTIRQQLGTRGEIHGVKFEDYKELHHVLTNLLRLVQPHLLRK